MSLNGVNAYSRTAYEAASVKSTAKSEKAANSAADSQSAGAEEAAVYEKSAKKSEKEESYKTNIDLVNRMKADLDSRRSQLVSMVEKMLTKQGLTFKDLMNGAAFKVDDATRLKAQEDISENGYWGVEQTSDRLVSFAKGLTGGDPAMASAMRDAIIEGFRQAEERWGGKLPDICQQTYEATMRKLDAWENGE